MYWSNSFHGVTWMVFCLVFIFSACTEEKTQKERSKDQRPCEFSVQEYGEVGNTYKVVTPVRTIKNDSTRADIFAEAIEDRWIFGFSIHHPRENLSIELFKKAYIRHLDSSTYRSMISRPYSPVERDSSIYGIYTSKNGMQKIIRKGIMELIIELENGEKKIIHLSEEESGTIQRDIQCVLDNYSRNTKDEDSLRARDR